MGDYRITSRTVPLIPDREKCPHCGKEHRVRVSGSMHYIRCKKKDGARFLVGWDDVYTVIPPKESIFINT